MASHKNGHGEAYDAFITMPREHDEPGWKQFDWPMGRYFLRKLLTGIPILPPSRHMATDCFV